jgi:hypothetical protein
MILNFGMWHYCLECSLPYVKIVADPFLRSVLMNPDLCTQER